METSSIVQLTGDNEGSTCGYCHSKEDTSFSTGLWAYHLHPQTYQTLIDGGWRRSGKYLYKPDIAKTCCPAYTIRLDSQAFVLSSGNKKAAKKVRRLLAAKVSQNNSKQSMWKTCAMTTTTTNLKTLGRRSSMLDWLTSKNTLKLTRSILNWNHLTQLLLLKWTSQCRISTYSFVLHYRQEGKDPWVKQPKQKKNAPKTTCWLLFSISNLLRQLPEINGKSNSSLLP
ncbi:hypothetical protein BCR33DRAFT_129843 [Rhizoclosmatium globosum]|uniref:N-end aminoacyl transferase N-terminal domain-containing protein n=1 Tax=Rhizoclosmatium globosum TaxID=329046 RepID=A0A1Y2CHH9_9FUNG|nr:hypothetical protein BCR33DRAFT_129843 [Rhizoclosmatium globosum]|eukprot:ORY46503.1 hypothetical protein BCR33DRAFT_129843 [Rhizoclosmatium globosum]